MTAAQFRRIALSFPGAVEGAHMGHADFRVHQKVFATLGYPTRAWGVVKLTLPQQRALVDAHPGMFEPVRGGWGRKGYTSVRLARARPTPLRTALQSAWRNCAPPPLREFLA